MVFEIVSCVHLLSPLLHANVTTKIRIWLHGNRLSDDNAQSFPITARI